jgi:uncharacterized protein (DUF2164 family)
MAIELNKDAQSAAVASIQRYIAENLDLAVGNMQARSLLDYVLKEIAPSVYNQAIADAQRHLQAKVLDLDVECYEKEFDFWKTARPSAK